MLTPVSQRLPKPGPGVALGSSIHSTPPIPGRRWELFTPIPERRKPSSTKSNRDGLSHSSTPHGTPCLAPHSIEAHSHPPGRPEHYPHLQTRLRNHASLCWACRTLVAVTLPP